MSENRHLVGCPTCNAKVQAEERGFIWGKCGNREPEDACLFVRCVVCGCPMVIWASGRYQCGPSEDEYDWGYTKRVWPSIDELNHPAIPVRVAKDLLNAKKCLDAGVYSATVVMCGRALEGVVREKCGEAHLFKGLAKLREMRVIDDRLYEWSELLRKERNLGAHSNDEDITRNNARDLYDFVLALCEFVYVLTEKYNAFVKRKGPASSNPQSPNPNP